MVECTNEGGMKESLQMQVPAVLQEYSFARRRDLRVVVGIKSCGGDGSVTVIINTGQGVSSDNFSFNRLFLLYLIN